MPLLSWALSLRSDYRPFKIIGRESLEGVILSGFAALLFMLVKNIFMNTLSRLLSLVMVLTIAFPGVYMKAQHAYTDNLAVNTSGYEVDSIGVVGHLQAPGSDITIEAPEALLLRAMRDASAFSGEVVEDANEEQADADRVLRTKSGKVVGYRVQVYADNNVRSAKVEARKRERALGQAFPDYGTYVSYASPYWRLRVGDFRSQYDAEKAAAEIRKAFPHYAREVRVVRDRISTASR